MRGTVWGFRGLLPSPSSPPPPLIRRATHAIMELMAEPPTAATMQVRLSVCGGGTCWGGMGEKGCTCLNRSLHAGVGEEGGGVQLVMMKGEAATVVANSCGLHVKAPLSVGSYYALTIHTRPPPTHTNV